MPEQHDPVRCVSDVSGMKRKMPWRNEDAFQLAYLQLCLRHDTDISLEVAVMQEGA